MDLSIHPASKRIIRRAVVVPPSTAVRGAWLILGESCVGVAVRRLSASALRSLVAGLVAATSILGVAAAQDPTADADTRVGLIAQQQAAKATELQPYVPNRAEELVTKLEEAFLLGGLKWHPFFESAYAGGGFTLGAGYMTYVSPYNTLDVRGSITLSGYKRLEAEFRAPRLFNRRGVLSVVGGWREATEVGFYGFGTPNTSQDDRANYSFEQPYGAALLEVRPTRGPFVLTGGLEVSKWDQGAGSGTAPSVDEIYTPDTLPGLGASPVYLHTQGSVGFDWRDSPGYTRRGGYYGITLHDFADTDDQYGFSQIDYEAIQHVPILRDAWVLSLRGRVQTTYDRDDQVIPFFMQPSLGGGSSLRGFASWRFRDRHSLLLSAEWRVLVNRFIDTALFYDAGKVTAERSELDFTDLKDDYGIGFRLHGPMATPLRIELAKSNEGLALVFSAKAAF